MESKSKSSHVNDLHPTSSYDEVLLKRSLLFVDGLKDLRNVKEQLYSAAEHFEDSSLKNDQKQMLLESLKNYISQSLIKTIDHLGSVMYKVDKFLDENVNEVTNTKLQVLCIEQRLQTCQVYANHSGISQQSLMMYTSRYQKRYPVQEGCISKGVKLENELIQSSGLRKGSSSGQASAELPSSLTAFSFSKAAPPKRIEKRSRSISPLHFPIKRSGSVANQSPNPIFSAKLSASSVLRSISPNSSKQQPPETWRSQSLHPQRQSTRDIKVYSKKTRNLFKAMLSIYKSKNKTI